MMEFEHNHRSVQCLLHSVPESMIQKYGDFSKTACFKLIHNGETFRLPHYNLDVVTYYQVYIYYLKILLNADVKIEMFYIYDKKYDTELIKQKQISNILIEDFILKKYSSKDYAYYIRVDDVNKCDIGRSLITNSTFQGECNICYQISTLKHYYACDIKDKRVHHGICGPCYMSWYSVNPTNTCPTCRACKINKP